MSQSPPSSIVEPQRVGVIAIGRNEGDRLIACLRSLRAVGAVAIVYVDSGSTDGSPEAAAAEGADIVALDMSIPFTAARARNAGVARLLAVAPAIDFIQFVDGDCTLDAAWTSKAVAFLSERSDIAVVCGRRREKAPDASLYNALCDEEWETPIGEAAACGGDALVRRTAFDGVGGYRDDLIAGEEPEMCIRLKDAGWRIWRLGAEMTLHDAAIYDLAPHWRRAVRAGHAFAEVSHRQRRSPNRLWAKETRRALLWTGIGPVATVLGVAIHPVCWVALALYPLQIVRLARRAGPRYGRKALTVGALSVLTKFAEAKGIATFWISRLKGRRSSIIEYKSAGN
ncbi:MAG: glycosyltransferase [Pseudomonadota bacterium]